MSRNQQAPVLLIVLGLGLLALIGVAVLWPLGAESEEEGPVATAGPERAGPTVEAPREVEELIVPEPFIAGPRDHAKTATTVLWPVRVELELAQAGYLPRREGVPRIGSGATARLSGRAGSAGGGFESVTVHFEAGPNAGRTLHSDDLGRFGATDLYPGLNVVRIRAASGGTSRREVRTRQGKETQLNLGFGRLSNLYARVQDGKGEPIEGALVDFDGQQQYSNADGIVNFAGVTSGHVLVEVTADGYSAHKELVGVTGRTEGNLVDGVPQLRFTLQSTGSIEVVVQPDVGTGPVQLFVMPSSTRRRGGGASIASNAGYPWHRLNPIQGNAGGRTLIEGLPAEAVKVYAFRAGATAPVKVVSVQPGDTRELLMPLEAAPTVSGRVLLDGEPVAGARVRLEAPNRVRATTAFFEQTTAFLESAVLPELPSVLQEVSTKSNGHFRFSAWEDLSRTRYIEAVGPDGRTWAGRFVDKGQYEVDLELREMETARATLALDFQDRYQGLGIEVFVDGRPQDATVLPSDEELVIAPLREGTWRLKVDWHGEFIHAEDALELGDGTVRLDLALPEGAIHGQDEDTWTRAGKRYPFASDDP